MSRKNAKAQKCLAKIIERQGNVC